MKRAADAQRKRTRIRNIAFVVVSIFAVLAGLLYLRSEQQRELAEEQRKQADQILAGATNIIAELQHQMDINTKKKTFEIFQTGADHGDAASMSNLAFIYRTGFGVAQDYAKAREWYEKAADKGNPGAMSNLGGLYRNGQGVVQDYVIAREWYEKAAAKGNAFAMSSLGALYEGGQGVAQDYPRAREWYERAADHGDAEAVAYLEKLSIREAAKAGRYSEALQLQEALTVKVEEAETKREGKAGEETAEALLSVAWYALFAREFTKALTISDRAHALFPDQLTIETNRAHALMFLGRREDSRPSTLFTKASPSRARMVRCGSTSSLRTSRTFASRG